MEARMTAFERRTHWEGVYDAKQPGEVSWYQERALTSLALINQANIPLDATIADIGGGASTLVDDLIAQGRTSVIVLDISEAALGHARARLGSRAERVQWIAADVTQWRPRRPVALWHDRAVLHFLTEERDQRAYGDHLREALTPNGWAVIAGFAPGGPTKCSGLDIVQHNADSLAALLGDGFALVTMRAEIHRTPWNAEQAFCYHLFHRQH
jgi:hypothetical protein